MSQLSDSGPCPLGEAVAFLRDDLIARGRSAEAGGGSGPWRPSSQPRASCAKLAILMEAGSDAVGCILVAATGPLIVADTKVAAGAWLW